MSWNCVRNCGACCYLAPAERPFLDEYLDSEQLALYHSLVGQDGWCRHFEPETRTCGIYEHRPAFCRVSPEVLVELYDEAPEDLDAWATHCCREHIEAVHGARSPEMGRFNRAVR